MKSKSLLKIMAIMILLTMLASPLALAAEETPVSTSPMATLFAFIGVIVLLLVLISKFDWHVMLALLVPLLLFGALPSVNIEAFKAAFVKGFGGTLGEIGVVIALGCIIAEALKETNAVQRITLTMTKLVGKNKMPLALAFTGFILGIAVFSDVAYIILNPLVHSLAEAAGVPLAVMSTGLVGALQLTHALVPPTPGPLAAAAVMGADIGLVILFGAVACFFGTLGAWAWGLFIGKKIDVMPSKEYTGESTGLEDTENMPGTANAFMPILIPVLLIAGTSVAKLVLPAGNMLLQILNYLGWPVVALTIGLWLAYSNVKGKEAKNASKQEWVKTGLQNSAMILIVTGLGGSLSHVLRGTPVVDTIANGVVNTGLPPIFLPFIIGIIGNTITGSTTVGVITAGSLVAPMLGTLGISAEAAMLAGGSGAVIIKYVNSSYFWVCTSLSEMEASQGIKAYGGATFVGGICSFLAVWAMTGLGIL
ncbi:GntP family permease [Selenihalanaerobacter shriftii]|uniref:Gluconate:H+ symporter, GntP family n=1 Tax=Selenihalanaerobacter shriftii TaxID=142842 RepID=A0A1T4JJJ6_9FIRM|nr:SLC13 family permease [Selenihalanaerobacter shriftii]SJZ30336.1 gluconate:H+ symporter, GntP family [Selenihalanaerobacter shriftii]